MGTILVRDESHYSQDLFIQIVNNKSSCSPVIKASNIVKVALFPFSNRQLFFACKCKKTNTYRVEIGTRLVEPYIRICYV